MNSHGLKTLNSSWISDIIFPDSRNSFDFGFYTENIPKSLIFLCSHDANFGEFYPMLGCKMMGNLTFLHGKEKIPTKIYSTLVHNLKQETNMSWKFSKNTTYSTIRKKLKSMDLFLHKFNT